MSKELRSGLLMMLVMTLLTGLLYPALVTVIAQIAFPIQAGGSLIVSSGRVVGSRLIGQNFNRPEYFHPRPSAAGTGGYDPTASGGTNLGPTSAKLFNGTTKRNGAGREVVDFDGIKDRLVHYCVENGIPYESSVPLTAFEDASGKLDDVKLIHAFNEPVAPLVFRSRRPVAADAVTASASGLDPDISPENASAQAARVARVRRIPLDRLERLIAEHVQSRDLGFLGEPRVNVLELNLALDEHFPTKVVHER
jgi:potassium-transporting ATPase KdpC subunit